MGKKKKKKREEEEEEMEEEMNHKLDRHLIGTKAKMECFETKGDNKK